MISCRLRKTTPRTNTKKKSPIGSRKSCPPVNDDSEWSESRRLAVQEVWGEGFISPGGAEYLLELVKPLGLDPAMSVLDLGAEMGGGARAIANEFGVYVTGMDPRPELAETGMAHSVRLGLAKKAGIAAYDSQTLTLKDVSFNRILVREVLYSIKKKERLLDKMARALKSDGQILFTDYLIKGNMPSAAVKKWSSREPGPVHLATLHGTRTWFEANEFEIPVCENETADYRQLVLNGWNNFSRRISQEELKKESIAPIIREAELWTRRMAAFDSGGLDYYRIVAFKK